MNECQRIMEIFANIAEQIYVSVYGKKSGKELTLTTELKSGAKLQIKIIKEK